MKLTTSDIKKLVTEELKKILKESFNKVNEPIVVKDQIFYWSTSRAEEVPTGFMVSKSGPIEELIEAEQIYEEVRKELNPNAPSRS